MMRLMRRDVGLGSAGAERYDQALLGGTLGVCPGGGGACRHRRSLDGPTVSRLFLSLPIAAMLNLVLLHTPASACSPQALAMKVNTLTDLMVAQESGLDAERSEMMKRVHAVMEQATRQPDVSYDGLCAGYDQLIRQLKSPPRH